MHSEVNVQCINSPWMGGAGGRLRHTRGNPVQAAGHPAGGVGGGPTITPHAASLTVRGEHWPVTEFYNLNSLEYNGTDVCSCPRRLFSAICSGVTVFKVGLGGRKARFSLLNRRWFGFISACGPWVFSCLCACVVWCSFSPRLLL